MKLEDQRTTVYKVDPSHPETDSLPTLRTEELLLNMGPQHPSTHGVLKVILELEGERIVKSTPVMGFLHRGVEKLAEGGTYHQFIPHTDRLDYVCAMYNNFAYCRAVEKLMDITVPDRAEYLRTLVAEVQRIIGHLFWLGTQALDIGAMTVFFYTFRDREILLDWFDELCGARLTTSWYRIGGVERDFTPSLTEKVQKFLDYFPPKIDEYVVFGKKPHLAGSDTRRGSDIRRRCFELWIERPDLTWIRSRL
jgi:NADH:ubiquinone oxidoreductase subunit D